MTTDTKKFKSVSIERVQEIASSNDYKTSKVINFTDRGVKIEHEGESFILTNKGKEHILSPLAVRGIVKSLELPVAMQHKLETYPDLLAHNINYMIDHKGLSRKALIKNKQVVAFADPDATLVKNEQVLESLNEHLKPLIVDKVDTAHDGTFRINAVQEDDSLKIGKSDIFRSGVFIRNNPYGVNKTSIEGYLGRLACLNGMIDGENVFTAPRIIDTTVPLWLGSNIKRARDTGEILFNSIKELKNKTIDLDLADFMEGVFIDLQIPASIQARIISRVLKYGAANMLDIMNHITYIASHYKDVLDDHAMTDRLMRAGSHFAQHIAETCGSCNRAIVSVN